MRPISILHLDGSREDQGGILSVLRNVQEATIDSGMAHEVAVHEAYVERRQPRLNYRRVRGFLGDDASYMKMVASGFRAARQIRDLLKREKFEVVHGHSRTGWLVGWLLAGKIDGRVVLTNHSYAHQIGLYRRVMRSRALTPVLLTPQMARHYGVDAFGGGVRLISACCADRFFRSPLVERRVSPRDRVRLVGVGTLVRWKRWHLIVEALATLPSDVRGKLDIVVYGPFEKGSDSEAYAGELESRVETLGLGDSVRFPGSTDEIRERVGESDWFILPSKNEPCSVALLEAMAMGRPVVASRSGGSLDIVQDTVTGLLFDTDNVASLAEVLRRIAAGGTIKAGPHEIRESVRGYSATAVGATYARLYRELVEESGPT